MNKKILVSLMIFGLMLTASIVPNILADPLSEEIIIIMEYYGPAEDINHDGVIDVDDVSILIANYGMIGEPGWVRADITKSGDVNTDDVSKLVGKYGIVWIVT